MRQPFTLSLENINPYLAAAVVTVDSSLIDTLYQQAAHTKKNNLSIAGFEAGHVPLNYVEQNYRSHLLSTTQALVLRYGVLTYLYKQLLESGILIAGHPRLGSIFLEPGHNASFPFELSVWPPLTIHTWKNFTFKAPKRKNYKDIDRQVHSFIKDEQTRYDEHADQGINVGDWVGFDIVLLNDTQKPLIIDYKEALWLRLGQEEADLPLHNWFLGKKEGDSFFTQDQCFQEYFHHATDTPYTFKITITHVAPHAYFCFQSFKNHFKLQTKKELHSKLIEVFSFRNDLSQRRAMVEEALKLIITKHAPLIPNHFILRQQEEVLYNVRANPDYQVYKTNTLFKDQIKKLAEKQLKEQLVLDQLAHYENITCSEHDIKNYLTLTQRPRMQDYLYFAPPSTKVLGQQMPISSLLLGMGCRREKMLNHLIHHWTRSKTV